MESVWVLSVLKRLSPCYWNGSSLGTTKHVLTQLPSYCEWRRGKTETRLLLQSFSSPSIKHFPDSQTLCLQRINPELLCVCVGGRPGHQGCAQGVFWWAWPQLVKSPPKGPDAAAHGRPACSTFSRQFWEGEYSSEECPLALITSSMNYVEPFLTVE